MIFSKKKKVLSALMSLAMIGTMVASVPFTASADTTTTTPVGVSYTAHVQSFGDLAAVTTGLQGTTGKSKRVEALSISLTGAPVGASITYQVQGQSYGWQAAKSDGAQAGTTGKAKRIEALKITISGLAGYEVQYRAHVQSLGTTGWVTVQNGTAIAAAPIVGTVGKALRIEAYEVRVVAIPTLNAVNSTIAVGGQTAFTFKDANGNVVTPSNVTYSVDSTFGSISNGVFTAAKSGSAVVTAIADGLTYTTTIKISGTVTGVSFSTPTAIIANEASYQTITVNAVDANGYAVSSFNGTATVAITGSACDYFAAGTTSPVFTGNAGITSLTFTNGVASFEVMGGSVAGITDTVAVSALTATGATSAVTSTVFDAYYTPVAQVATSVSISADSSVPVNVATSLNAYVSVLDQAGKVMIDGDVYSLTANISGACKFGDSTVTAHSYSFFNTNATTATTTTIPLLSVKGVTGSTVLTVTSPNLTSGSVAITSALAGDQYKIVVADTNSVGNTFTSDTNSITYTATTVDSSATPTGVYAGTGVPTVYVYDADGTTIDTNITVDTVAMTSAGVPITDLTYGKFVIADSANDVGSYVVVVKDSASTLVASTPITFTETAGAAKLISASVANNYVAAASPTTTVSVQVTDLYGNAVADSGVAVSLTGTSVSTTSKASFDGATTSTTPAATVYTNASGVATSTFAAQAYGDTWTIAAAATIASATKTSSATVKVVTLPVASLAVTLTATGTGSTSQVVAGTTFSAVVAQYDTYGNSILTANENDNVKVTVSNVNSIDWSTVGTTGVTVDSTAGTISGSVTAVNTALAAVKAAKSGAVSFTAQDTSLSATSASTAIAVKSGAYVGYAVYDASGNVLASTIGLTSTTLTVSASTAVAITVKAVDVEGNVVVFPTSGLTPTVTLHSTGTAGTYSFTSAGVATSTVVFTAGVSASTVYYINNTAGTYTLTITAA